MFTPALSLSLRAAFCACAVLLFVGAALSHRRGVATAAGGCNADETVDAEEQAFLKLINQHRAQNGRAPLGLSYTLSRAAAWKSRDLGVNAYFGHDDLSRTWVQRIRDCGYGYNTYLGENIAAGVASAQSAFDLWKNSSGHNANMLGANYTTIGIGREYVAGSPYGWYWTTEFGGFDDGYAHAANPGASTPLPAGPAADTTPPQLSVDSRARGNALTVTARATDDAGVQRVEFWIGGSLIKTDKRVPYDARLRLGRGMQNVTVKAYDAAGNVTTRTLSVNARHR
jgi:uncharacterized protein YkwD